MPFFGLLPEVDGLNVPTMLPELGLGLQRLTHFEGTNFFASHLHGAHESTDSFSHGMPQATAFFQGRPRQLIGLAAAGASGLFAKPKAHARDGEELACRTDCPAAGPGCCNHEDFLFGSRLQFDSVIPKQSMFVGWFGAARLTFMGKEDDERAEEENKGWSKVVPQSLLVFSAVDVVSALVAIAYRNNVCDVPLLRWLWGGILLGAPTDALVKAIAWLLKPRFKYYKLKVHNCRQLGGHEFELSRIEFWDEFGRDVTERIDDEQKDGDCWIVTFRTPVMISCYRICTSSSGADKDPVTWELLATNRKGGDMWRVVNEVDESGTGYIPQQRSAYSPYYSDLRTISEDGSFRQAFLAEVFANAASFAWLVAGSAWISQGSETCVDSAPGLWYYCFLQAVLTWSCLGTVTTGLIVSAVAMILVGAK